MLHKLPKSRLFTYRPKYYEPPPDDEEEESRIKFRRFRSRGPQKKRSVRGMLIMVVFIIALLIYWFQVDKSEKDEFKFEEILIEQAK